jgi:hypothetical protein
MRWSNCACGTVWYDNVTVASDFSGEIMEESAGSCEALMSYNSQRKFDMDRPVGFEERRWRALVRQGFAGEDICFEKT